MKAKRIEAVKAWLIRDEDGYEESIELSPQSAETVQEYNAPKGTIEAGVFINMPDYRRLLQAAKGGSSK